MELNDGSTAWLGDALKNTTQQLGRFALTSVALAALSLGSTDSWAIGLGRLAVQSALGETLRAEIDVTSMTSEEAANLKIRIAPPESYRSLGVDYNSVLPTTQASLLKRADGRSFLRLTSDRVVQEPFVDVILELSWSTGRLVREYTLLFDPPVAQAPVAPPAPAVATAPVFSAPVAPAQAAPRSQRPSPASAPASAADRVPKAPPPPSPATTAGGSTGDSYLVQPGDTLTRIASRTRQGTVSLDQTLVSLYRGNPKAFIGENMNRLKAGVVLKVPTAEAAATVDAAEARQVILAQSADFGSFRQRLAGAVQPAAAQASTRKDAGKVRAEVDDRKDTTPVTSDKLTLSKAASAAKPGASEVRLSKEKEKQDAAVRMAELSKNVEELKKLSGAASAAAVPAPPPIASQAPVPAPEVPVAAAPSATASAVAEAPPAPAVGAAVAPVAPPPPVAAPKAASEPAPADEPGFLDFLLEINPLYLAGGAGVALALLGFGVYRARRAKLDTGETSFLESRLQPDSFFGSSGGQRIDTRESAAGAQSSMNYSLSQLDAIGDVDPVAEADVYLAYGRDLQAEEILKEAMRSSPERLAIRTKLLEVYAKRRDTKGYELLATQLFSLTGGNGEDWQKAQELGLEIDPENPLYQPGGLPVAASSQADSAANMAELLGPSTMPQLASPNSSGFADSLSEEMTPPNTKPVKDVDFDLDLSADDKAAARPATQSPSRQSFDSDAAPTSASAQPYLPPSAPVATSPGTRAPLDFDMSSISLDLDTPADGTRGSSDSMPGELMDDEAHDTDIDPLARKLELAEEFRQIGDAEGARDLLQEVAAKAEGALKVKAQNMLNDLG
ncbi:MAG: FimV/HubP family polar landmark protein [Burkholderiales bacterium]